MTHAALELAGDGPVVRVDVEEVSGAFSPQNSRYLYVQYVDCAALPLFLVTHVVAVFADSDDDESYFVDRLLKYHRSGSAVGLLFKSESCDSYVVFYIEGMNVKALVIEFTLLGQLDRWTATSEDENLVVNVEESVFKRDKSFDNTKLFDLVLETKRSFTSKKPPVQPSSVLNTTEQINLAVSKVVLSGLRLRGLSSSSASNVNDKLNIKEIYSMTYKSTLFALRKYNYSFNGSQDAKKLNINDIQDIVERLLLIFIDIDNDQSPFLDRTT